MSRLGYCLNNAEQVLSTEMSRLFGQAWTTGCVRLSHLLLYRNVYQHMRHHTETISWTPLHLYHQTTIRLFERHRWPIHFYHIQAPFLFLFVCYVLESWVWFKGHKTWTKKKRLLQDDIFTESWITMLSYMYICLIHKNCSQGTTI